MTTNQEKLARFADWMIEDMMELSDDELIQEDLDLAKRISHAIGRGYDRWLLETPADEVERWSPFAVAVRFQTPAVLAELPPAETAWLLETPSTPRPNWVAPGALEKGRRYWGGEALEKRIRFVSDTNEALRFARQADAEAFREMLGLDWLRATEHCWPKDSTT